MIINNQKLFKLADTFAFWLFALITFIFIIIEGICAVYFLTGVKQLITGHRENDMVKIKSGWLILSVSLIVLLIILLFYVDLINR
jgi:hypothetical protein